MSSPHDPDDTGIDDVLRAAHARLVADLRGVLDVDGGAERATEAGALTDLTGDLADRLDVDAGLAAITAGPAGTGSPDPARRAPSHGRADLSSLRDASRIELRAAPAFGRLRATIRVLASLENYHVEQGRRGAASPDDLSLTLVRRLDADHDLVSGLGLGLACDLDSDLDLVQELDDALDRARAIVDGGGDRNVHSLRRRVAAAARRTPARWAAGHTPFGDRDHRDDQDIPDEARAPRRDLGRALAEAHRLALGLALAPVVDPVRARDLVVALVAAREHALDVARGWIRHWAVDGARQLELPIDPNTADPVRLRDELDALADDFRGADLRDARVPHASRLDGIRWSAETRWPPDRAEDVRAASREVEPGVFEVTGRPGGRRSPSLRG